MKNFLRGSTALVCLGFFAPSAFAACTTTSPTTGQTVSCSGTSTTPVAAGAGQTNVTVNVGSGAQLNVAGSDAITVRDGSTINLLGGGVNTSGANSDGVVLLIGSGQLHMTGGSSILTTGDGSQGAALFGDNQTASMADSSIVTQGNNATALRLSGNADSITLSGASLLSTLGNSSFGLSVFGNNATINLNATSRISTSGTSGLGIYAGGNSSAIVLNDHASVATTGLLASGISLGGNSSSVTLNGASGINTTGSQAYGIAVTGTGSSVTLNDHSSITTAGFASRGVKIFGDTTTVTLNDESSILTADTNGTGILVQGNNNSITLNGTSSIRTGGSAAYGFNIDGTGNVVTIGSGASVITSGPSASALLVQQGSNVLTNYGQLKSTDATSVTVVGDNNAGNTDHIFNYGAISSASGTAIDLKDGNDVLTLGTGSQITGLVDGGAGLDRIDLTQTGSAGNVFANVETLNMDGLDWSLYGNSTFGVISVINGRLAINGNIAGTVDTQVFANGTLGGTGTLTGAVDSNGTIAPGNSVGTLNIVGNFVQTGGAFDIEFGKGATDRLNVTGAVTLNNGPAVNVIPVGGAAGTNAIFLHSDTSITGGVGAVNYQGNGAAIVHQTATDLSLITVDGTSVVASDFAASETGLDFLDDVAAEQIAGLPDCSETTCNGHQKHLWARGFGRFANESARDGNQAFDYRIAGTAMGGDMEVAKDLRVGVSLGYSNTEETLSNNAADADIDSGLAALYAHYQHGRFFLTGAVDGGWQSFNLSRNVNTDTRTLNGAGLPVGSLQSDEADATTHGWLFGSSLQAGARFNFPHGWLLTPSASVSYQHQWVNGYQEHGAGDGDVSVASHQADALRLKAQLVLSQDYQLTGYTITPHLKLGVQQQYNLGGHAEGAFSDGTDFSLAMTDNSRTMGLAGVGVQVAFENGLSTYVDYDGALASGRTVQSITGGLRYSW